MKNIIIRDESRYIGELIFNGCFPVNGAPIRAENFYITYLAKLNNKIIDGEFSERFYVYKNYIFITEIYLEKNTDSFATFKGSSLKQFDLETNKIVEIANLMDGYITPIRVEQNKIIYTKNLIGSSIFKEFEQEIKKC